MIPSVRSVCSLSEALIILRDLVDKQGDEQAWNSTRGFARAMETCPGHSVGLGLLARPGRALAGCAGLCKPTGA